jgi:hypothetical protein
MSITLRTSALDLQKPARSIFKTAFKNSQASVNYAQASSSNNQGGIKESALMVSEIGMSFVEEERRKQLVNEEARDQTLNLRTTSFRKEEANHQPSPFSTGLTGDQQGRLSNSRYSSSPRQLRFQGMRDDSLLQGNQRSLKSVLILPDAKASSSIEPRNNLTTEATISQSRSPIQSPEISPLRDLGQSNLNFFSLLAITKKVKNYRSSKKAVFRIHSNPLVSFDTISILKESLKSQQADGLDQSQYLKSKVNRISNNLKEYEKEQKYRQQLKEFPTKNLGLTIDEAMKQIKIVDKLDDLKVDQGCPKDIIAFHDLKRVENMSKQHKIDFQRRKDKVSHIYERRLEKQSEICELTTIVANVEDQFNKVFEEASQLQSKRLPNVVAQPNLKLITGISRSSASLADNYIGRLRLKTFRIESGSPPSTTTRTSLPPIMNLEEKSKLTAPTKDSTSRFRSKATAKLLASYLIPRTQSTQQENQWSEKDVQPASPVSPQPRRSARILQPNQYHRLTRYK